MRPLNTKVTSCDHSENRQTQNIRDKKKNIKGWTVSKRQNKIKIPCKPKENRTCTHMRKILLINEIFS